ncbi:P-II family nitrogen regulator [Pseudarthrobacter scleromae]|uniref:Nitrogen regulatory protein P-II n=1 Tax=Pseudarthrobacter scleromae TaxID=158897 RepID=A0ABQ2CKV9_9MICC|nr:transcriptional regulator [Pseudarthrobacter scleromae]GGI93321.1 nitrogen regulatory protein P-II [Pseudarthrobacter scleromae]
MKFTAIVVIAPDDLEERIIEHAQGAGATGVTILPGKGIGGEARKTFFGLTFEGTQSVLLMVVGSHLGAPILKELHSILVKGTESRGLAFAVPIEHLTGIDMRQVVRFEEHLRREGA